MEAVAPYLELASNYILTPYGVAALAGVILSSVLLLVFSTQKELSYEDYNKLSTQPQKVQSKPSSQQKKPKKEIRRRKPKKNKEEQEVVEEAEDDANYDIVAPEEVPMPEEIPLTMTEPQDHPKKKNKKDKKKKQKKEVAYVEEDGDTNEVEEESAPEAATKPVGSALQAEEEEEQEVTEEVVEEVVEEAVEEEAAVLLEEAMEPASSSDTPDISEHIPEVELPEIEVVTRQRVKSAAPVLPPQEKKSKKNKKKGAIVNESGSEGIFQIVDQANLSETDIETLLAILKSKEGDDNWVNSKASEETKDSLRKRVQVANGVISDLERSIEVMKQDMLDRSEDKTKLTLEIRNLEKRHQQERETLSGQLSQFSNMSQSRAEEVARLKKEVEDRDRINNNLQLQLAKQRAPPTPVNPNIDLKNRMVELEEELQESRDQYNDLERNLQQVNILEKKLLDKDSTIAQQKCQLQNLEIQLSSVSNTDAALLDAQAQMLSLKAELEKLQDYVTELESQSTDLPAKLAAVSAERDSLRGEVAALREKEVSSSLEAAAAATTPTEEVEEEVLAKSAADDSELAAAQQLVQSLQSEVESLQSEVKTAKEKITELERAPSESSMSSTVDISAEITEQLQLAESQLNTVKADYETAQAEQAKLESECLELKTKVSELEEIVASREPIVEIAPPTQDEKLDSALKEKDDAVATAAKYLDAIALLEGQIEELKNSRSEPVDTEKLDAIVRERDEAISEAEKLREDLARSEELVSQLQADAAQSEPAAVPSEDMTEKLDLAVRDRDSALADSKKYQEVLSKTEGLLSQLQVKFESDIQKWAADLEEKRTDLEREQNRVAELEQQLADEREKVVSAKEQVVSAESTAEEGKKAAAELEDQLASEKRWHSETLLKLKEAEASLSQQSNKTENVETLQKANEMEQKWHAETLTQLQQANSDITLLQDKLVEKTSEVTQLTTENEELKGQLIECNADLPEEVTSLQESADQEKDSELKYHIIELTKKLREANSTNEYLRYRLGNQAAGKKFTSI